MTLTIRSCEISIQPQTIDSGAGMTLTAQVISDPVRDLRGQSFRILDHTGAEKDTLSITDFDGEINTSATIEVEAPDEPGTYIWHIIPLIGPEGAEPIGTPPIDEETPFTFTVSAHATRLLVWDVPPAIESGRPFAMKIGVKCSSGCDMTGRPYEVVNQTGEPIATGALTGETWPGSDGLYYAELELMAPDTVDLCQWQVWVPSNSTHGHHQAATATFGVRTVAPAEFTVRIEAVDSESGEPLPNFSVVMHPYRTRTDENGVAEVKVAKGSYRVFVSGPGHYPMQREMEIVDHVATQVPLKAEPTPIQVW